MATYTTRYNLKKPATTDFYDIADNNDNCDKIETALNGIKNELDGINNGLEAIYKGTYNYGTSMNGTDSYSITFSTPYTELLNGMIYHFKADVSNTGVSSLKIDNLPAKAIKIFSNGNKIDTVDGDIKIGVSTVVYDGTDFILVSGRGTSDSLAQAYLTAGTYTYMVPRTGMYQIICVGGGGGGGGNNSNQYLGGGGGGAGYVVRKNITLTRFTILNITVGSGGAAASGYDLPGSNGGISSVIGTECNISVLGGYGGGGSNNAYGGNGYAGGGGGGGSSGSNPGKGGDSVNYTGGTGWATYGGGGAGSRANGANVANQVFNGGTGGSGLNTTNIVSDLPGSGYGGVGGGQGAYNGSGGGGGGGYGGIGGHGNSSGMYTSSGGGGGGGYGNIFLLTESTYTAGSCGTGYGAGGSGDHKGANGLVLIYYNNNPGGDFE
jgi:hypothetical protein